MCVGCHLLSPASEEILCKVDTVEEVIHMYICTYPTMLHITSMVICFIERSIPICGLSDSVMLDRVLFYGDLVNAIPLITDRHSVDCVKLFI